MARRSVAALHGAKVVLNCMRNGFVWSHVAISNRNRNMMLEQYCTYRYDTHIVICRYQRVIAKAHRLSTANKSTKPLSHMNEMCEGLLNPSMYFSTCQLQYNSIQIGLMHSCVCIWNSSFGRIRLDDLHGNKLTFGFRPLLTSKHRVQKHLWIPCASDFVGMYS